jgi:hypothetical protein
MEEALPPMPMGMPGEPGMMGMPGPGMMGTPGTPANIVRDPTAPRNAVYFVIRATLAKPSSDCPETLCRTSRWRPWCNSDGWDGARRNATRRDGASEWTATRRAGSTQPPSSDWCGGAVGKKKREG